MNTFEFSYPVRIDDLDFMGIIGNSEWVTLLTRARIDLLEHIQYPITQMMKDKIGGVVSEMTIKYMKPAKYGDVLKVEITPHNHFSKGLCLKYIARKNNHEICVEADVTIIFVDSIGTPVAVPEIVILRLSTPARTPHRAVEN
tara:strand:- start:724 stop:1152 length:429 start_codon:yes stop_codon:yes gene_type:complete